MTPEKAQQLLDDATPWTWEVRYTGIAFELSDGDTALIGDPDDKSGHLIAAAPELAEIVAGLRYEYAVQVNGREWLRNNDEGRFVLTGDPMRALRHYHPGVAAAIAKGASAQFSCECRVVRRLVGEPEVVS